MDFLKALITTSEKAANIARVIRQNDRLFKLLVEKKESDEANPRFVEDFKTLADVLIQQMVKYDIGTKFPEISDKIFGEESNEFCNKLDEKITVDIQDNQEKTAKLLSKVLNGDQETADILAAEVFKNVELENVSTKIPKQNFEIDINKLAIWIDPIDATAEYINGEQKGCHNGIYLSGLKCVTILIGVYNIDSGHPIIGVVNQPFAPKNSKRDHLELLRIVFPHKAYYLRDFLPAFAKLDKLGNQFVKKTCWSFSANMCLRPVTKPIIRFHCNWGVSTGPEMLLSSCCTTTKNTDQKIAVLSSTESDSIKTKLKKSGFDVIESCGAGYKILTVILGLADVYILSKSTTYFWDTCGPQGILRSLGGNIISYKKAVEENLKSEISYKMSDQKCNHGGLIAYRREDILSQVIDGLKTENL